MRPLHAQHWEADILSPTRTAFLSPHIAIPMALQRLAFDNAFKAGVQPNRIMLVAMVVGEGAAPGRDAPYCFQVERL